MGQLQSIYPSAARILAVRRIVPSSESETDELSHSGGEFHTFRLPSPGLWLDIFQKMVAAGLNSVRFVLSSEPEPRLISLFAASTSTVRISK